MGDSIERERSLNEIQQWTKLSLDCVSLEIIANSVQISNIELIFTKYSKPEFYNILP